MTEKLRVIMTRDQAEAVRVILGVAISDLNKNRVGCTIEEEEYVNSFLAQLVRKLG